MKQILLIFSAIILAGCDPHIDSVFLGRSESKFLGDVGRGDTQAVKAYLDRGGNVNLQDEPGMTPLHHAIKGNWNRSNFDIIKLLIDKGANVNAECDRGRTPLHEAGYIGSLSVVKLLIEKGADVNALDNQGRTPKDVAFIGIQSDKDFESFTSRAKTSRKIKEKEEIISYLSKHGG